MTWKSRQQIEAEEAAADALRNARIRERIDRDVRYAAAIQTLCGDRLLARFAILPSQMDERP